MATKNKTRIASHLMYEEMSFIFFKCCCQYQLAMFFWYCHFLSLNFIEKIKIIPKKPHFIQKCLNTPWCGLKCKIMNLRYYIFYLEIFSVTTMYLIFIDHIKAASIKLFYVCSFTFSVILFRHPQNYPQHLPDDSVYIWLLSFVNNNTR